MQTVFFDEEDGFFDESDGFFEERNNFFDMKDDAGFGGRVAAIWMRN